MKHCISCNKAFDCTSSLECWCNNHPQLITAIGNRCYCAECLNKQNANFVNSGAELSEEQFISITKLGVPKDLLENIDYFINEEGNFVFSRWYHIRKGYCCKNDCLHCPY